MPTESLKLDPPKRKRRWFQFSLRTLMIVVTLLAAMSAVVVWVVRDRDRLIQEREKLLQERDDALDRLNGPNVSLRMYKMGDTVFIEIPASTPPKEIVKVQRLYPDARIKLVPASASNLKTLPSGGIR